MGKATVTAKALRAAEKRAKALELVLAGMSYRDIAKEVGWKNQSSVTRAVAQELKAIPKSQAEELRQREILRMDQLQLAQMNAAMQGDPSAAGMVLKIITERARMLGLYDLPPEGKAEDAGAQYIDRLEAALERGFGSVAEQRRAAEREAGGKPE